MIFFKTNIHPQNLREQFNGYWNLIADAILKSNSPGESHPHALTHPFVNLLIHSGVLAAIQM